MSILSIDPGPVQSAYIRVYQDGLKHVEKDIIPNGRLIDSLNVNQFGQRLTVLEEPISRPGSGRDISDTAFETGRMAQACGDYLLISRSRVRGHMCGKGGNDSKVIDALLERFEPDLWGMYKIGSMSRRQMLNQTKSPCDGFFYGFKADIWQAFALAVTYYDLKEKGVYDV